MVQNEVNKAEALREANRELDIIDGTLVPTFVTRQRWSEYEQIEVTTFGEAERRYIYGPPTPGAVIIEEWLEMVYVKAGGHIARMLEYPC